MPMRRRIASIFLVISCAALVAVKLFSGHSQSSLEELSIEAAAWISPPSSSSETTSEHGGAVEVYFAPELEGLL